MKKKYVYKNTESMNKMYSFYDKSLKILKVNYKEKTINTTYGETHVLIVGDENKPPIFTLHGGNGISTLNIRLLMPLLEHYNIISPDVIGMPGKSFPYRTLNSNNEDYGYWICEILDNLEIKEIPFVVSSYSSAMMLSLASVHPERISKAALIVPSGIAHGSILPIISKMAIPFIKYYYKPSESTLDGITNVMVSDKDKLWNEFFELMMSSYKMEMRPPKEYKTKELINFKSPVIIFASDEDIFFPANKVFKKADSLFQVKPQKQLITGKHLPSKSTMVDVCEHIYNFFEE